MRIVTTVLAGLMLTGLIAGSAAFAGPSRGPVPDVFEPPALSGLGAPFPQDTGVIDHEGYDINVRLFPPRHFLQAEARIAFRSLAAGLSSLHLVLYNDTLRISRVTRGTDTLPFTYDVGSRTLTVQLRDTLGPGDRDTILVSYSGYITTALGNYCRLDNSLGFSMLPYVWYPAAYDLYYSTRRDDRAAWRVTLTVPRNWRGLSCGVLLDSTVTDSTQTSTWQPTGQYVAVSFGAGPYLVSSRDFGGLPLRYYDTDTSSARSLFAATGTILDYLNRRFGAISLDKLAYFDHRQSYGAAHPSLVMMPLPNDLYPLAHEVGHQWWGISVARRYDPETWLNEGFATYMSVLLYEDSLGMAARREALDSTAAHYLAVPPGQDRPIVPAPWTSPYCTTILYGKGVWVLHMLRGVLGDSAFFTTMRTYALTYRDSSAVIADFRRIAEQAGGRPLDWFFNEWLYGTGAPAYAANWQSESLGPGNYRLTVEVRQTDALFDMPLPLSVFSSAGRRDTAIRVSRYADTAVLTVPVTPDSVVLDYDDWVLDRGIQMTAVAESPAGTPPSRPAPTVIRRSLPFCSAVHAQLFDLSGRIVLDLRPGPNDLSWLAPGVHFVRVRADPRAPTGRIVITR